MASKGTIEVVIRIKDEASKGLEGIGAATDGLADDLLKGTSAAEGMGGSLRAAAAGGVWAQKKFSALGIAVKDNLTGKVRDADDILADTVATLRLIPNEAIRDAKSIELLGGAFVDVEGDAEGAADSFDLMAFASSPAAAGLVAIGAAAVGAAAGVFKLAQGASDWVNGITKVANETQLTSKTVVALESALGAAGLELGEGAEAAKGLGAVLKEAVLNGGDAEKKFTDLGIAIRDDLTGEALTVDEVFRDTIDTLRLLPNETERGAQAMNLFGESGTRLKPIIEGGTAALDEWGASAEAAGKVINDETLQASADFDAAMVNINNVLEGLVVTIGTDLVPIISALAGAFLFIAEPIATAWGWLKKYAEMANIVGIASEALAGDFEAVGQRFSFGDAPTTGGGGQSQAESDRISASVEAGFLGVDGLTDAQRAEQEKKEIVERDKRRAAFTKAAEDEIKERASVSKRAAAAPPAIDEFAGQNAFNALVESLFGEQVLADIETMSRAQQQAADNLELFNQYVSEGSTAQLLAAAAVEESTKEEAAARIKMLKELEEQLFEGDIADAKAQADAAAADAPPTGNEKAAGVAGALGAVQGGLTGILSALGPAGAVASGIVGVASNLPAIIDGIIDSLDDILIGLVEGIPKIFFELIPALVKALVKDIPSAIADALLGVLEGAFPGLKGARAQAESNFQELSPLEQRFIRGMAGNALGGGRNQSFAEGGFVSQTGMALVHRGEEFIPQNGVSSSGNERRRQDGGGGRMQSGGNTFNINVTGFMDSAGVDRFVEQMNRYLGPNGSNVAAFNG